MSKKMEKKYKPEIVEKKWLENWDDSLYYFDADSAKSPYIIDTPPPYPTGDFHVGNALNWCYIDFIARYKRMRGYNVMFPQGWDCHGLPTEVKVEERHGLSKRQIDKQEFRELCKQLTRGNIAQMKGMMQKLGMSIDWSKEFVTMDDRYKRFTQLSFLKMYHNGLIYQEEYPVNWCPRCETAIAFAEVEYEDRDASLNYVLFKKAGTENECVEIATTRPELLASCVAVAVHPDDERYKDIAGKELVVPIFEHAVTVYEDESVDPAFGTGVVMICTFGDRQDVRWWKLHNLPLIESIDERGRMTAVARGYEGLSVTDCKKKIIEDLNAQGLLRNREPLQQNVGVCWRCKTPIEIISTRQWFVRVMHDDIIKASEEIAWYPEHFAIRLKNWVDSMEWDWCISRQRIFSVPIPVWYCLKCGTVKVASEDDLPVDPAIVSPKGPCANCGGTEFKGEEDVLDTWMDSSLSALWVSGWDLNAGAPSGITFPVALRPQGHDIIRTWTFYTILRSLALAQSKPWDTILINGMVLGEDGYKMSKSRNNFISPDEVIQKHGADVFRQWAAIGGAVGSDVQFRWKDIVAASKFMQKLWNILRFAMLHLSDYERKDDVANLRVVDKWLLSKLNKLVRSVTDSMETYKFDEAMKDIRTFAWNVLADDYIELAKSRLYDQSGDEGKESARYALYVTLQTLSKLIAPFAPFFAEEMHYYIENDGSVHNADWPAVEPELIDRAAEAEGDLIADIARAVRRYKSERGIALNAPLGTLAIYTKDLNQRDTEDIENATATKVELSTTTTTTTEASEPEAEGTVLDVNGTKVRIKS
jgi:valyl-tRNA synthetase